MLEGVSGGGASFWGQSGKVQRTRRTAEAAMTDSFVRQIQAWAKADARQGVYMSEGFRQLNLAHMHKYVSPDRAGAKAEVMSAIQVALREKDPKQEFVERMLEKLTGKCSARLQVRTDCQTAEVRAPNGEVIASYNSSGSGWTDIQTREEHRFFSETAMVYLDAYRAARAELKAPAGEEGPALDVQA